MSQRKASLLAEAEGRGLEAKPTMTIKALEELLAANPAAADDADANSPVESNQPDQTDQPVKEAELEGEDEDKTFTKAGKRSAKAVAETEAEAARQARRQADSDEEPAKPKKPIHPPRSRLERRGKGYRQAHKQLEIAKVYDLSEAVEAIIKTAVTKFDSSVEVAVALGVDIRQADQNIRSSVILPAGSGRRLKIAVVGSADDLQAGQQAGADIISDDDFWQNLDQGQFNFDLLIATPQSMAKLGPYAKFLGPRGLMPNPKSGTVTRDVARAVTEAKLGRVEYRADETGVVHLAIGKVSFGSQKLTDNLQAFLADLRANQPSTLKGKTYIKSIYLTTTMGPSLRLANNAGARA